MRQFKRGLLQSRKFRIDCYRCNSHDALVEQLMGNALDLAVPREYDWGELAILKAERWSEGDGGLPCPTRRSV